MIGEEVRSVCELETLFADRISRKRGRSRLRSDFTECAVWVSFDLDIWGEAHREGLAGPFTAIYLDEEPIVPLALRGGSPKALSHHCLRSTLGRQRCQHSGPRQQLRANTTSILS